MRNTDDLITELREASEGLTAAALVVGFEATTEFVWNREPHPLEKLNAMLAKGGEPVGMIGYLSQGGIATFCSRPLEEYVHEDWVQLFLDRLVGRTVANAKAAGLLGEDVKLTKVENGAEERAAMQVREAGANSIRVLWRFWSRKENFYRATTQVES